MRIKGYLVHMRRLRRLPGLRRVNRQGYLITVLNLNQGMNEKIFLTEPTTYRCAISPSREGGKCATVG
jgi:hypothetical protein